MVCQLARPVYVLFVHVKVPVLRDKAPVVLRLAGKRTRLQDLRYSVRTNLLHAHLSLCAL